MIACGVCKSEDKILFAVIGGLICEECQEERLAFLQLSFSKRAK